MGRGILLVLTATLFWGTSGTASTYAPDSASTLSVAAVRLLAGALGLVIVALVTGRGRSRVAWPWKLMAVGSVFMAASQFAFFTAVADAGVAVSTVLTIGTAPVFAGVLSAWYLRHPPDRIWVIATAMAIIGAGAMVLGTAFEVGGGIFGLLLAIFAGAGYAVYVTVSKQMMQLGCESIDVTASIFGGAALVLLPAFLLGDWHWVLTKEGAPVALYLGLATNTIPYLLFGLGLVMVPVATAATLTMGEPLVATMLGVVWLGERLTLLQWGGVVLLFVGLLVLASPQRFQKTAPEVAT